MTYFDASLTHRPPQKKDSATDFIYDAAQASLILTTLINDDKVLFSAKPQLVAAQIDPLKKKLDQMRGWRTPALVFALSDLCQKALSAKEDQLRLPEKQARDYAKIIADCDVVFSKLRLDQSGTRKKNFMNLVY